jgi:methylenetetrahydrofolate dehydrogenase (NADP+)/methenyltetrahydrofolate cyclohydrolase
MPTVRSRHSAATAAARAYRRTARPGGHRPDKDVDGFHSENVGGLSQGRAVLAPCTPSGCLYLLEQACGDLRGKHAVVIGRSNIVGKPMAALLLQGRLLGDRAAFAQPGRQALCRQADIVIAAVGRPRLIDASWLKPGAVVIDVGINRIDDNGRSRLVGDVDFDSALPHVAAITPVPGGVGPMTIAFLMKNTVTAALATSGATQPIGGRMPFNLLKYGLSSSTRWRSTCRRPRNSNRAMTW